MTVECSSAVDRICRDVTGPTFELNSPEVLVLEAGVDRFELDGGGSDPTTASDPVTDTAGELLPDGGVPIDPKSFVREVSNGSFFEPQLLTGCPDSGWPADAATEPPRTGGAAQPRPVPEGAARFCDAPWQADTRQLGEHVIKYSVRGAAGNPSELERTVRVVDTLPPVVTPLPPRLGCDAPLTLDVSLPSIRDAVLALASSAEDECARSWGAQAGRLSAGKVGGALA